MGACLAFAGCAGINPDGTSNCKVQAAGAFESRFDPVILDQSTVDDMVARVLRAASFITDWRFNDQTANCQALVGFRVYSRVEPNYELDWYGTKHNVSGHTVCALKYMVIGRPQSGNWFNSALAHELLHAMQGCESPKPIDEGQDEAHANWVRDQFYFAIDEANKP